MNYVPSTNNRASKAWLCCQWAQKHQMPSHQQKTVRRVATIDNVNNALDCFNMQNKGGQNHG